jgi:hypothetical protein
MSGRGCIGGYNRRRGIFIVGGLRLRVLKSYEIGLPVYIFLSFCNAGKVAYCYSPEGIK